MGQTHLQLREARVTARRLAQLCHRDADGTDAESGPVSVTGSPRAGQPLLSPLPAERTCSPGTCCPAGHLLCPPLPWRLVRLPVPLERPCGFRQKGYFPVFIQVGRKRPLPAPTLSSLAAGLVPVGCASWPWHPLARAASLPHLLRGSPLSREHQLCNPGLPSSHQSLAAAAVLGKRCFALACTSLERAPRVLRPRGVSCRGHRPWEKLHHHSAAGLTGAAESSQRCLRLAAHQLWPGGALGGM